MLVGHPGDVWPKRLKGDVPHELLKPVREARTDKWIPCEDLWYTLDDPAYP